MEIEFALQMLGISEEEAKGIWATLAAICHLGCAGVTVGKYTIYLTFYTNVVTVYNWRYCTSLCSNQSSNLCNDVLHIVYAYYTIA